MIYRRRGVREYWIVDPIDRHVEIHEFGKPSSVRIYAGGRVFGSDVLPGIDVKVDAVFAR